MKYDGIGEQLNSVGGVEYDCFELMGGFHFGRGGGGEWGILFNV